MTDEKSFPVLTASRSPAVVRPPTISDAVRLCQALADGDINTTELTLPTPRSSVTWSAPSARLQSGRSHRGGHGAHGRSGALVVKIFPARQLGPRYLEAAGWAT